MQYGGLEPHQWNCIRDTPGYFNEAMETSVTPKEQALQVNWHTKTEATMTMCTFTSFYMQLRNTCNIVSCSAGVRGVLRA